MIVAIDIPEEDTTEGDKQSDQDGGKCTSDTALRLLNHQTHSERTFRGQAMWQTTGIDSDLLRCC
jgi:hypothetical protein